MFHGTLVGGIQCARLERQTDDGDLVDDAIQVKYYTFPLLQCFLLTWNHNRIIDSNQPFYSTQLLTLY